jgi:ferredoxin--NADP+ reductase
MRRKGEKCKHTFHTARQQNLIRIIENASHRADTPRMTNSERSPVSEMPVTEIPAPKAMPDAQTVTFVKHWTDRLFSFRVTRPASLRFRSGEFVMIGLLKDDGKPLLRAYSIASPAWDEELEFYSIKVQDGPLTSRLQHITVGDQIILRPKPVGTLVHDALLPGKRLWFFATGTGIAPFASLLREPQTYEDYDQIILTHTCREVAELAYGAELVDSIRRDDMLAELMGEGFHEKLVYYPTTTREPSAKMGRITDLLKDGTVFQDLGITGMSPETDRAMVCGSMGLNMDIKDILESYGLHEGANSEPAEYVVEKAFVG